MARSREVREIFDIVFEFWIPFLLAALGIVTNALCIIVFARQGFQESSTLSLIAIAVMDLLKCVVGFIHRVHGMLAFVSAVYATNWYNITFLLNSHVQTVAGALVHVYTTYVTFERCLCVSLPFKVRLLVTKKVTIISLVSMSFLILATHFYTAVAFEVIWVFDVQFNRTMASYRYAGIITDHVALSKYMLFNSMFWQVATFTITAGCTCILVVRLKQYGQFRAKHGQAFPSDYSQASQVLRNNPAQKFEGRDNKSQKFDVRDSRSATRDVVASSKNCKDQIMNSAFQAGHCTAGDSFPPLSIYNSTKESQRAGGVTDFAKTSMAKGSRLNRKDAQLVKMLLLVVLMYIINIITRVSSSIARLAVPEFSMTGRYSDIYFITIDVAYAIDFVNSSTNLFIYLAMSSQFRNTFWNMI